MKVYNCHIITITYTKQNGDNSNSKKLSLILKTGFSILMFKFTKKKKKEVTHAPPAQT